MSRRGLWEKIFERFDPVKPVEIPAWRADRPLSPFEDINRSLDRPFGIPRLLLTGTMGTGKTTELLRIAEARVSKEFVVFLDLVRHFEQVVGDTVALQHVSPWEVCFLAGIALIRSAEERLGFVFPPAHIEELRQAWLKLARSSGEVPEDPAIDIAKLAKSMVLLASTAAPTVVAGPAGAAVGLGLGTLSATADAAKWSLPIGLKKKALPDQDAQVQTLLQCVNVLIGLVQQRSSKVLLIIDGLDRIEATDRAKELRLRETGMNRRKIRLLESVVADPDHRLPEGEDVSILLTTGALLPYPDGSEWYYPHPLLMMKLIQRRPVGSMS